MDADTRLRRVKELESALRAASDPADVHRQRSALLDAYSTLLVSDPAFALTKEIVQATWKVFYRAIDEYRKRLRRDAPAEGQGKEMAEFLATIAEASRYYRVLVQTFSEMYGLSVALPPGDVSVQSLPFANAYSSEGRGAGVEATWRMCIFLGDLERYRGLYGTQKPPDWLPAAAFYRAALQLNPANGNPHNQLAVLATYREEDLEAMYRYMRSCASAAPFSTSRENLALLFEKNRLKVAAMPPANPARQRPEERARALGARLVRVHGCLYTRAMEGYAGLAEGSLRELAALLPLGALPRRPSSSTPPLPPSSPLAAVAQAAAASCGALAAPRHLLPLSLAASWLRAHPRFLRPDSPAPDPAEARARQQFWGALAPLLNRLGRLELPSPAGAAPTRSLRRAGRGLTGPAAEAALPEEVELRGFVHLFAPAAPGAPGELPPSAAAARRAAALREWALALTRGATRSCSPSTPPRATSPPPRPPAPPVPPPTAPPRTPAAPPRPPTGTLYSPDAPRPAGILYSPDAPRQPGLARTPPVGAVSAARPPQPAAAAATAVGLLRKEGGMPVAILHRASPAAEQPALRAEVGGRPVGALPSYTSALTGPLPETVAAAAASLAAAAAAAAAAASAAPISSVAPAAAPGAAGPLPAGSAEEGRPEEGRAGEAGGAGEPAEDEEVIVFRPAAAAPPAPGAGPVAPLLPAPPWLASSSALPPPPSGASRRPPPRAPRPTPSAGPSRGARRGPRPGPGRRAARPRGPVRAPLLPRPPRLARGPTPRRPAANGVIERPFGAAGAALGPAPFSWGAIALPPAPGAQGAPPSLWELLQQRAPSPSAAPFGT
eukprot:tig00000944_g5935.t1